MLLPWSGLDKELRFQHQDLGMEVILYDASYEAVRIPEETGRSFRSESGHVFRTKTATHSVVKAATYLAAAGIGGRFAGTGGRFTVNLPRL